MREILLLVFMLSGSLLALDWEKDLDSALATAKKEHKNVMVMVESDYCRWCKKMKGRTLTDDTVEKILKHFVVVKVMREDSSTMAKLPSIEGVPTIFFMKDNKAIIETVVGYFNVKDFISFINKIENKSH